MPKKEGRPLLIPELDLLEINQEFFVPWPAEAPNGMAYNRRMQNLLQAVKRLGYRTGKKFHRYPTLRGLLVRRVK